MSKKIRLTAFLLCEIDEEYEVTETQFDQFFTEFDRISNSDPNNHYDDLNELYSWLQSNKLRSRITYTDKYGTEAAIENVYELKEDDADETI